MRSLLIVWAIALLGNASAQHISKEELAPFNFLVGNWKVDVDARLSKNGPWEKSEARSVIKKEIGETIFEEEYPEQKKGESLLQSHGWAMITEPNYINVSGPILVMVY
jgi:hypothetical protein